MTSPQRRPTIKDVAREAGVTYPTVSRVLSNKPYVAPDTRERVMRAIEHLGYRPSAAARSMVSSRTHTLAMLVPHLSDPNFGTFFVGAEHEARTHGYSLLVADHESLGTEDHLLTEHRVDGLLVIEPYRFGDQLESIGLPTVRLDDVPLDHQGGAALVAAHLRELGHERVVMLGGPPESPHATMRHAGLRQVYPDATWIPGDWTAQTGYDLFSLALESQSLKSQSLKSRSLGSQPTAIFAANDFVGLGVIHAAHEHGLGIPSDLSVVGFDDAPLAKHFHPPLTTVRQPFEWQGGRAAALLIARLNNQPVTKIEPQPLEFIIRQSTGPPPIKTSTGSIKRGILSSTRST